MANTNDAAPDEMLAVLSDDGQITDRSVPRRIAHRDGVLHGGAHTFICKRENGFLYVLLQRRSADKDSFPNCLDISSAGHMTFGDTFRETAVKELYEELGLKVRADELVFAFTQRIEKRSEFYGKPFINREIDKVYILVRDVDISTLTLQKSEITEVVWTDAQTVSDRLKNGDAEICIEPDEFEKAYSAMKKLTEEGILC